MWGFLFWASYIGILLVWVSDFWTHWGRAAMTEYLRCGVGEGSFGV